VKPGIFVRDLA